MQIMNVRSEKAAWITWETHRRSRSISARLGADLYEFDEKTKALGGLLRYVRCLRKTIPVLAGKYSLLYVQNPSFVLAFFGVFWTRLLRGKRVVVDAHNSALDFCNHESWWIRQLARYSIKHADIVIVTNGALAKQVEHFGGRATVLQDPVPQLEACATQGQIKPRQVVFITTWASDEPVAEMLRAAVDLGPTIDCYFTGRCKLPEAQRSALPPNVHLTGFLSEEDYLRLIGTAAVIVDLTTRENCLVCGAYEALAVRRPLVVSDSAALRELLADSAIYCDNTSEQIVRAVTKALEESQQIVERSVQRSTELDRVWNDRCAAMYLLLAKPAHS